MSLLDRYGIKEVADVTFYELKDNKPGRPVLYLDTLKISTTEQTAEATEARGGKGNASLLTWDYGKEITLNLEDALFSKQSLEVVYGSKAVTAVESLVKNKYVTPDEKKPFFTKDQDTGKWCFNLNAGEAMGLHSGGATLEVRMSEEQDHMHNLKVTAGAPNGEERIESVLCSGIYQTNIPSDIPYKDIKLNIILSCQQGSKPQTVQEFKGLHSSNGKYDEVFGAIELSQDNGFISVKLQDVTVQMKGYTITDPADLYGDIEISGTYFTTEESSSWFKITEAGHQYSAEVHLLYEGHNIPLMSTGIDDFDESIFDESAFNKGKNEIYLVDAQLLEIKAPSSCTRLDISSNTFPGTYYVTADTYARNEKTGKDEFFQLIVPRVKVLSESNSLTMEADGEPTVFSMSLKAMKPKGEPMMSLIQCKPPKAE